MKVEHDKTIEHRAKRMRQPKRELCREMNCAVETARKEQFKKPYLRKGVCFIRKLRFVSSKTFFTRPD